MLWGHTLRSPHAHARIVEIDISRARRRCPASTRCSRTTTSPGRKTYGLEFPDQPVLAIDRVRYYGEPVAIVAAEHPEQARRAAEAIVVDLRAARAGRRSRARDRAGAAPSRPADDGPRLPRRPAPERRPLDRDPPRRPRRRRATSRSRASTRSAGQDQAFLGPESGLAIPDGEGGVDVHVATQWLHVDRDQVAPCLGLAPGAGADPPRRRGRRLRRPRGPLDADPRRDARAPHRPAGEDRLQPRGVVHGPRAPAPGQDLGRAPRDPRRPPRLRARADPARRRCVRLQLDRGDLERLLPSRSGRTGSTTR